jgi:hypothetical protein
MRIKGSASSLENPPIFPDSTAYTRFGPAPPTSKHRVNKNEDTSYVEPWVSYALPSNTTVSLSAETVYDWNSEEWAVPLNFIVDQLISIGFECRRPGQKGCRVWIPHARIG